MEIMKLPFLSYGDCIVYTPGFQDLENWDFLLVSCLHHLTGQLPFQEETTLLLDGISYSLRGDFRDEFLGAAAECSRQALLDVYNFYKTDYESAYSTDFGDLGH